jgi:hypothetical protein
MRKRYPLLRRAFRRARCFFREVRFWSIYVFNRESFYLPACQGPGYTRHVQGLPNQMTSSDQKLRADATPPPAEAAVGPAQRR